MIKNNKIKAIVSSILILLPTVIGFFAKDILPEEIIIHWGLDGRADGWGSPAMIFFILPISMLLIHWLCLIITSSQSKSEEQNKKITSLIYYIIPVLSLGTSGAIFATAVGYTDSFKAVAAAMYILLGVMFVVIGNYMPKSKRNRFFGIKIKWTVANDDNWQATHRFSGKIYAMTGIILLISAFLPLKASIPVAILAFLISIILPCIYSHKFYKKQIKNGEATKEEYNKNSENFMKESKVALIILAVTLPILAVAFAFLMFTGDVSARLDDTTLFIEASYWDDIEISYDDVDSIEYRKEGVDGSRLSGFGSARLMLGSFKNNEFGVYTRYTYTGSSPCIVIMLDEKTVVLGLESAEETERIYSELSEKIAKKD